jgi:hypothetical protein
LQKYFFGFFGTNVSGTEKDKLRRITFGVEKMKKVNILGNNNISVFSCVVPNLSIRGGAWNGGFVYMYTFAKMLCQCWNKPPGNIGIKEQFHQLCGLLAVDDDFGNSVPFRGKCQGRPDMYFLKFRVIFKNFLVSHARGEPAENVAYGNTGSLDTGLSKTYSGVDGDMRSQFIHYVDVKLFIVSLQGAIKNLATSLGGVLFIDSEEGEGTNIPLEILG